MTYAHFVSKQQSQWCVYMYVTGSQASWWTFKGSLQKSSLRLKPWEERINPITHRPQLCDICERAEEELGGRQPPWGNLSV